MQNLGDHGVVRRTSGPAFPCTDLDELIHAALAERLEALRASGAAYAHDVVFMAPAHRDVHRNLAGAHQIHVDDAAKHTIRPGTNVAERVHYADINQGALDDCWVLAPICSLEKSDPGFLSRHVAYDAASDSYRVTLFDGAGQPTQVHITNSFVGQGDELAFAAGDAGNANLASVYEKAFADYYGKQSGHGDYASIAGGPPAEAMIRMTGETPQWREVRPNPYDVADKGVDSAWLKERIARNEPTVLTTTGNGITDADPIVPRHAYPLIDVQNVGGRDVAVLYNPWGSNPVSAKAAEALAAQLNYDAGHLAIPVEDVQRFGHAVTHLKR